MSEATASGGPVLVFGGTFDPVHEGHVAVAAAAADALGVGQVRLIPAGDPPHRAPPQASAAERVEMLRLAFGDDDRFVIDQREIRRGGRSYMVDTLADLRREIGPHVPLILLLGADAFLGLPSWHRWRELLRLAHLAVFPRPGIALRFGTAAWPDGVSAPVVDPAALRCSPAGQCVVLAQPVSGHASTAIRAALAAGERRPAGLPPAVADWIATHRRYGAG